MSVEVKIENGAGRIFLNRAQKVNALDSPLLNALRTALLQLWEEAPLARSIDESIARFAQAYENRSRSPKS
jgi:enoyl-CoA hydratase/carnithine racemase